MYGMHYFYNYLFGKQFTLITDNEPLSRIFHQDKALPQMTSARLLRYASFLSGFDYKVSCKRGKENKNTDCLSQAPLKQSHVTTDMLLNEEASQICTQKIYQLSNEDITYDIIKSETVQDPQLRAIIERIQSQASDEPYTLNHGIIFRQDRIFIPEKLRRRILEELHATYVGVMKMKLTRRYVYWPKINQDIEKLVRSCEECALIRSSPAKAPVHPWHEPDENWERLHMDYAGPFQDKYFLMVVDAKSKWAEVRIAKEAPSTTSTMSLLQDIFSTHGYPAVLVSDNASIFTSEEFR
nr:unnamed protein product [Callosobruchus chinensis]